MRLAISALLIATGCIEYEPVSEHPPVGVPNPRDLEIETETDVLIQTHVPQVDVLWLVDNSSSMAEEQAGITENFPVFLDYFVGSGLDWHIGVISTDMVDPAHHGKLVTRQGHTYVDTQTPFPDEVLAEMTLLGVTGSGDERGREPIFNALGEYRDTFNQGFYRDEASLHVIVISDEEDSSVISEAEWIAWMKALKWGEDQLTFSSIVSPNPVCPGANDPGVEYIRYTQALGGIFWPICDENWATVLEQLGLQAVALSREYFLSSLPVPGTIEVYVTENDVTRAFLEEDWAYDQVRNSVIFAEFVPAPGNVITIEYDVLRAAEEH